MGGTVAVWQSGERQVCHDTDARGCDQVSGPEAQRSTPTQGVKSFTGSYSESLPARSAGSVREALNRIRRQMLERVGTYTSEELAAAAADSGGPESLIEIVQRRAHGMNHTPGRNCCIAHAVCSGTPHQQTAGRLL